MATIGLVLLLFTGLVPGLLELTTSTSILQVFTRPITVLVGSVSPSAVWYTNSYCCCFMIRTSGQKTALQSQSDHKTARTNDLQESNN